ncbi:MAG TPA: hypothetical protein ENN49_01415 [Bacteroidales bacterium]|nr:hypothetical protein [Bacteroidales bacterium]
MEIYAVFGNPILHSKSPQLFNSVFREMGVDAKYTRIRPKSGKDLIDIILHLNIKGANITTPFKTEVVEFLDKVDADAKVIGGVNTITNINGKLTGYNTDHIGVVNSLHEGNIVLKDKQVLVLGAGPAAAAASFGLISSMANVFISNRTKQKALELSRQLNIGYIDFSDVVHHLNDFDVVVSALLPNVNPFENISVPQHLVLLDANYRQSQLSKHFEGQGCKVISGKRWLIHQAIASFKIYRDDAPLIETMNQAVEIDLERESLKAEWMQRTTKEIAIGEYDILISASNETEFKQILNNEISKTFGS